MSSLSDLTEEDYNYISNFWKPKVGNEIFIENKKSIIKSIDNEYKEQIQIEDDSDIYYIQDAKWIPTLTNAVDLLKEINVNMGPQYCRYGKAIYATPDNVKSAVQLLRQVRFLSVSNGKDIIETLFSDD